MADVLLSRLLFKIFDHWKCDYFAQNVQNANDSGRDKNVVR